MLKSLICAMIAVMLTACANPNQIALGTSRDEVIGRLGRPTRTLTLPGGSQRLQYSLQPAGQLAWMVDLDGTGRVTSVRQVLTEDEFQRIVPGQWTRSDVEREFGPPGRVDGVTVWNGPVLTYRWRDAHGADMFHWVYLDSQGVVRGAHHGMELPGNFLNL